MARILVVDDSRVDQQVVRGLLEKQADWSVSTARDGAEALEMVETDLPDLVLTDLQMPRLDGLQLVQYIRNEFPLIPVVLMTAAGSEIIAVDALQKGAASYVPKTALATDLVETVRRVLALSMRGRTRRRLLNYLTQLDYDLENDLELTSSLVAEIRELVQERCLFDESECLQLATAVDEALSNAYYRGNLEIPAALRQRDPEAYEEFVLERSHQPPYCERRIHVRVNLSREQVVVTVRDEGPGFSPEKLPDPTAPDYLKNLSGRGVLLMSSFMDSVHFDEQGNAVTLVKNTKWVDEGHTLGAAET